MAGGKHNTKVAVPASSGLAWVVQSLELLREQASRLLFIALLMQVILGLVQVPLFGILIVLSIPGLSAGILDAFHVTGRGGRPGLQLLFLPLLSGEGRGRLIGLGALVFAIGILCVSLLIGDIMSSIDEARLLRLQQGDMEVLYEIDPLFVTRLMSAFLLSIAIGGTITFFAIPLIWFRKDKLWTAIAVGMRALVTNWKSMLVLGGVLMVVFLPVSMLTGLLLQVSAAGGVVSYITTLLMMILLLLFQLLLFGTQYCAFRQIFQLDTAVPKEPPAPDDSQLVA